jgi:hypothetical protein
VLSTPNLAGDLWALYRFEVSMVDSPERYLLARQLVERLGWERGSLVRKDMWEDNRWKDWGPEATALATVVEEIRMLRADLRGVLGGKEDELEVNAYEGRPGVEVKDESTPKTLGEAFDRMGVVTH